MLRIYLLVTSILIFSVTAKAQLLYPESYVVILDTAKHFKGSWVPSLEVKTPKELYVEINNTANLAYRFKKHSIVLANKFELTRNGSETILSGGYLYAKFKTFFETPLVWEHYGQYQWADARGLSRKVAFGTNLRYKIYKKPSGGLFVGVGPFYEFEEWTDRGVPDDRLPIDPSSVIKELFKLNFYISIQQSILEKVKINSSFYVQDNFEKFLNTPRLAGSAGVTYQITKAVSFGVQFRALYDFEPVVPVDKLWYNTFTELQVTF